MVKTKQAVLTIIVPSYNISKYVDNVMLRYIDKRFAGKLKVVFVDDGSTDDTAEKIGPWVKNNPDTLSYIHKSNGGHGSVINYGVYNIVDTPYFKIIDGDDWPDSASLLSLLDYLQSRDDDVVVTDFCVCTPGKDTVVIKPYRGLTLQQKKTYSAKDIDMLRPTIHSLTYKTEFYQKNRIQVREKVFYEDCEFVLFPMPFVSTFSYLGIPLYQYQVGNPSQSVSISSRIKHIEDNNLVTEDLLVFFDKTMKQNNLALIKCTSEQLSGMLLPNFMLGFYLFNGNKQIRKYLLSTKEKFSSRTVLYTAMKKNSRFLRFMDKTNFHFIGCLKSYRYWRDGFRKN